MARVLWIFVGLLVLVGIGGVIGFNVWLGGFLRSEAFRKIVSTKTSNVLRVDGAYDPIRWTGASAYTDRFKATGMPGAPVTNLEANSIRAAVNWRSVFDGAWRLEELTIKQINADFQAARPGADPALKEQEPAVAEIPSQWQQLLPKRFEIGRVFVDQANVGVGGTDARYEIRRTQLDARPQGDAWMVDGKSGQLLLPGRQPFDIRDFRLRLSNGAIHLNQAHLTTGGASQIEASGQWVRNEPYSLQINWSKVNPEPFLPEALRRHLTGLVAGEALIVPDSRIPAAATATGKFLLTEGRLSGLEVQEKIAEFTRSPQFKNMPVHEISGQFDRNPQRTEVENFVFESKGLLKLTGRFTITSDDRISGRFRVGIGPQSLQWIPGSQEKVFTQAQDGYLWTDLTLGGTLQNPTQDLSQRLVVAMGQQVIETGVDLLTNPVDNAREGVKKVRDLLSPLLP